MARISLKAIGFDLDGTLYPFFWARILALPMLIRNVSFFRAFRTVRKKLRTISTPVKSLTEVQNTLLAEELSVSSPEAERLIHSIVYTEWYAQFRSFFVFPYLRHLLSWLQEQGVKLAVLSDFPIGPRLEYLQLNGLWDLSMSSEETNCLKPHPHPFTTMCTRLEVSPEETLYVGNSEYYDIHGATKAGLHTALYRAWSRKSVSTVQFSSYRFLQEWLKKHCYFE